MNNGPHSQPESEGISGTLNRRHHLENGVESDEQNIYSESKYYDQIGRAHV
jgi:hypothetical protein